MNVHSIFVRVLEKNPNRGFFKKLGAKEIEREFIDLGEVKYELIIYGWIDTSALIGN